MKLLREYIRELLSEQGQKTPKKLPGDVVDYARSLFTTDKNDSDATGRLGEEIAQRLYGGVNLNKTKKSNFPFADLQIDGAYFSVKASTSIDHHPFKMSSIHGGTIGSMINAKGEGGLADEFEGKDEAEISLGAIAVSIDRTKEKSKSPGESIVGTMEGDPESVPHSVVVIEKFGPEKFTFERDPANPEKFLLPDALDKRIQSATGAGVFGGLETEYLSFPTPTDDSIKARRETLGTFKDLWNRMNEEQLEKVLKYAEDLLK